MYGIKVKIDNTESDLWLQSFSEYVSSGNMNVLTFNTREEAEIYAQNLELKKYNIEEYNQ